MKNISTGTGLVVLGLGVALHPLVSGLVAQATAAPSPPSTAAAVASVAAAQAGPTVVWMGVDGTIDNFGNGDHRLFRMWSDGRIELRRVTTGSGSTGCAEANSMGCGWIEVPPAAGGDGFGCRSDINGDRLVDGADLSFVLSSWGQQGGCEPEATYPCLDLGNLAGGVAFK